ncbi:LOW QUALITY PROTEIN: uncharacterized acetyltransferase At3g50280-like [Phalaenopsis equestris]|uniref:LOW QUALITY PROTEIN: uncharacterized acetyltransferase At3g50280-like n=1 Tax=Phalaenopsis equestris TaxID=78828 RepID=UPI0009E3D049|nr:LOW QUALITY PROTEIN: uncharacterized acetyltransferase At3g50280-like [Phalaenopsis equestris]
MPSSAPMVEIISKHTVKPPTNSSHPPLCHLTPWDVAMLCPHYIQKGLLFTNLPPSLPIHHLLTTLKASLSITLQHFYPLAGRLATPNHLTGGDIFIACCFNHVVGDGTSYWNFFNAWAEITRTNSLSLPPVHARWFIDGENPPVKLPFSDSSPFVERFSPPALRQRFFHFSAESIAKLKKKANEEIRTEENDRKQSQIVISSFQALCAMIWRAISRARRFPAEQLTTCRLAIQNRGRLRPPQSPEYFGNSIYAVEATAAAGELEANGLGWAARELNGAVNGHTDEAIRGKLREYHAAPMVYKMTMFDPKSVMVGSSPRFDMYGCDFGWGKGAAVRCGPANKFDGKVSAFPGREGDGSVDLEICLLPQFMADFLLDPEFLEAVSPPPQSLTKGLK